MGLVNVDLVLCIKVQLILIERIEYWTDSQKAQYSTQRQNEISILSAHDVRAVETLKTMQ